MPVKGFLSTKGLSEYIEDLAKAGKDVDAAADRALAVGSEVALDGMKSRVPVDTGNLRDNLSASQPDRDGNFHFVSVGLLSNVDADTARYGNVQEFGSVHTQAQPYVRPTFDADKRKILKAERESLVSEGML